MLRFLRPDLAGGIVLFGALAGFLAFENPFIRLPVLVLAVPWSLAVLARRAISGKHALKLGWLQGAVLASASLYWITLPVHDYGYLPWALAVPCPLLMGAVLGLYPAVFCWLLFSTRQAMRPAVWGTFAGLTWIAIEALRGWLFSGFPWFPLAATLAPWPFAIQGACLVGAYGLSGILAACGVWLAGPGLAPRVLSITSLAVLAAYGLWSIAQPVKAEGEINAAMIQGNIDQAVKWDSETLVQAVRKYSALTETVLSSRPDIIIWPETSLTFFVQEPSAESSMVKIFARKTGVPMVAGAPGYERSGKNVLVFNRAYLISGDKLVDHYDKEHLVPFGEYAPFGEDIPILSGLLMGVGAFTPGKRTSPLMAGRLAMGMLICYESIFAELAQERVRAGANVLVNISNDAWFGRSAAPRQHLELAVLRAVEQNRFLLRATNTGITALIDPKGRISNETPLFQEAAVAVSGVGLITEKTLYHRLYGWIEGLSALLALALYAGAKYLKKRTHGE